jgi:hypothetical protein
MDPTTFQNTIDEHMAKVSGLDVKREYLGISAIGKCSRQVVREYLHGKSGISMRDHRMCYGGYMFEADLRNRLADMGFKITKVGFEVVADFDSRLRGHIDGEIAFSFQSDLLEVKSLKRSKFENVKQTHMPLPEHFAQVQLYMKYGSWNRCWIVYMDRESLEHQVVKVGYLHTQAIKFEMKAQRMLAHIDSGTLPECECRRCKD